MSIWRKFSPDMSCHSIMDIPLDDLQQRGIKGLLFDLDNTITEWNRAEVSEEISAWLRSLGERGFAACIVSNNHGPRVKKVADQLGLPYVYAAAKPRRKSYRRAAALLNLPLQQLAMVGDQLLTDVLGGNRAGLFTIFVKYINPREHWGTVHLLRPLERLLLRRIDGK